MSDKAQKLFDDIFRRGETPEGTARYLARLNLWLSVARPDYFARLRPGTTDADLDAFERQFGVTLPASFRTFYRWRDGQEDGSAGGIMGDFTFMPLAAIRTRKAELDGKIGRQFGTSGWWRAEWVPYLDNGRGDHPFLDLCPRPADFSAEIRRYWSRDPDRSLWISSFQSWIASLVESYEAGRPFTMKPKPPRPAAPTVPKAT